MSEKLEGKTMEDFQTIAVDENSSGERVDRLICSKYQNTTRNFIHKMFLKKLILVNNKPVSKHYKVKNDDFIQIVFPKPEKLDVVAENIPLSIIYEDDQLLVVNKPKGMVVHPAPGHYCGGTLVNALMWHCKDNLSGIGGVLRPGIVHRIDKDTSGLLVVAKTDFAHASLCAQLKTHSVDRIYEAVVYGKFKADFGTLDFPIGRSERDRKKMAVNFKNGKNAVTHYKIIDSFDKFSHIKLKLETGRTHQIRVHMAHVGHPLAGDVVYGPKSCLKELRGQCLCAKTLGFCHPVSKEKMHFEIDLDECFLKFLKKIENKI